MEQFATNNTDLFPTNWKCILFRQQRTSSGDFVISASRQKCQNLITYLLP